MVIREVRESELEELLSLYKYLGKDGAEDRNEKLYSVWKDIMRFKEQHIVVAEENKRIVSSCVVTIIPNLTHEFRPYAVVENVVTNEEYRKKGFATACLNYAKKLAKEGGCYKLMLSTGSKKESTLRFYEKAGYNKNDKTAFVQWL